MMTDTTPQSEDFTSETFAVRVSENAGIVLRPIPTDNRLIGSRCSLARDNSPRKRSLSLSSPFLLGEGHHPGNGGGAQYWNTHCMVPVHREWVQVPVDFFEQGYEAIPEIVSDVSRAELSVEPGTLVSSTGGVPWIGYLLLHLRVSRRHLLEMHARFARACRAVLGASCGDDLVS